MVTVADLPKRDGNHVCPECKEKVSSVFSDSSYNNHILRMYKHHKAWQSPGLKCDPGPLVRCDVCDREYFKNSGDDYLDLRICAPCYDQIHASPQLHSMEWYAKQTLGRVPVSVYILVAVVLGYLYWF